MKKPRISTKSLDQTPVSWLVAGLAITTLYFQTNLADPFNSPKMWIIILLASWLSGYLFMFRKLMLNAIPLKNLLFIVTLFIGSAIFSTVMTDFKYVAIFGDTQRRNGLLSYISLSIIMLASAAYIRFFNINRIVKVSFLVGLVTAIYGFMQTTGHDFIKWDNPYNSIIGTVGNPNFAAAVMAVLGVIIFASVFIKEFNNIYRGISLGISFLLLVLIYLSDAKQGLLSFILGCSIFLISIVFGKSKKLGIAASAAGSVVFLFALLGMLQIGPLEKYLYKPSVSVRGYYWRTGIKMLQHHPFTGVGMDRYGAYFKEYREVGYPLSYGFDITSSNAHNTFIQFFATGGLFLGISYLLINLYILRRAIITFKLLKGDKKLLFSGLFSAWIAFHAQSLVSIDNIGISIWGWVLGGAIVGLSISAATPESDDRKVFAGRLGQINLGRALVSLGFAVLSVLIITLLYRGENASFKSRPSFNLNDAATKTAFKDLELKVINAKLIDPTYSLYSGMYLIRGGFVEEGLTAVKAINKNDPRNMDALNGLALVAEQLGKYDEAIGYRLALSKLDPWNAVNYLALGKNYKAKGDLANAKLMLDKINSFASKDPIAAQAKTDLA
jgi:O-antigen ligase